jgi:flagella basal body P-ring formation protein FlgA
MFANILTQITTYVNKRLILTYFFPSLFFWGGLLAIYQGDGFAGAIERWREQPADVQLLMLALALAWVTFFALLLAANGNGMIRQFQGYWPSWPLVRGLRERRKAYHQKVLAQISETSKYDERIYYRYPFPDEPGEVLPTQLGNVLRNAERYPLQRYDMDGVLFWPRLYAAMPAGFAEKLDDARSTLDFMVVMSTLGALFAVAAGAIVLLRGGSWWVFLACLLGGLLVAWLAYGSAVTAAVAYGQLVKSAFDLYRDDLREALGFVKAESLAEDRALWNAAFQLIYQGEAGNLDALAFKEPKTTPETKPAVPGTKPARSASVPATKPAEPVSTVPVPSPTAPRDWLPLAALAVAVVVAAAGAAYLYPATPVTVPSADLPPYQVVTDDDLEEGRVARGQLGEGVAQKPEEVVGRYPKAELPAGEPITKSQLLSEDDASLLADTLPVSLPAGPATAYNGQLAAGDVVEVRSGTPDAAVLLSEAFVLGVEPVATAGTPTPHAFVVVLAVPTAELTGFLTAIADRPPVLIRLR